MAMANFNIALCIMQAGGREIFMKMLPRKAI